MTLEEILRVPTAATPEDRADDVWDDENRLSYSADGEKVLDAENYPPEVTVREGCRILVNGKELAKDGDHVQYTFKAGETAQIEIII